MICGNFACILFWSVKVLLIPFGILMYGATGDHELYELIGAPCICAATVKQYAPNSSNNSSLKAGVVPCSANSISFSRSVFRRWYTHSVLSRARNFDPITSALPFGTIRKENAKNNDANFSFFILITPCFANFTMYHFIVSVW